MVFKGFHEDVDSFSAVTYTERNFEERRNRENVVGKMYTRACKGTGRSVTLSNIVVEASGRGGEHTATKAKSANKRGCIGTDDRTSLFRPKIKFATFY